jgi:hypothetical protein
MANVISVELNCGSRSVKGGGEKDDLVAIMMEVSAKVVIEIN